MTYDTSQLCNVAVAVFVGCGVAALSFRLLPPLSPALQARRLLSLTFTRPPPPRDRLGAAEI